jgi:hypothetical protein
MRATGIDVLYADRDRVGREQLAAEFLERAEALVRESYQQTTSYAREQLLHCAQQYSQKLLTDESLLLDSGRLYAELFAQRVSKATLIEMLSYYQSKAGKEDIACTRATVEEVTSEMAIRTRFLVSRYLDEFERTLEKGDQDQPADASDLSIVISKRT